MNKKKIIKYTLRGIGLLVVAYLGSLVVWLFNFDSFAENTSIGDSDTISSEFTPLENAVEGINDSLPYYRYRYIKDSIENIKNINKFKNAFMTSGFGDEHWGLYKAKHHDTGYFNPHTPATAEEEKKGGSYDGYIMLGDYRLADGVIFFRDSGRNFLKYAVWDKTVKRKDGTHRNGHYETKEITIAAEELKDEKVHNNYDQRKIYIPSPAGTSTVLNTVYKIVFMLMSFWIIIVFFWLPIKAVEYIANGEPFDKRNIRNLHIIAFSLIGLYLFNIIIVGILHLMIGRQVPPEFIFSWRHLLTEEISLLICGVLVFILARAFKRGYRLQTEQELTI